MRFATRTVWQTTTERTIRFKQAFRRPQRHTEKDLIDTNFTEADGNIGYELLLDNEGLEKELQKFERPNYKKGQFCEGSRAEGIWECIDMSF
jgi:hypothetical protein